MKNIKENPRFVTMPQVHPAQVDCLCDVPGSFAMNEKRFIRYWLLVILVAAITSILNGQDTIPCTIHADDTTYRPNIYYDIPNEDGSNSGVASNEYYTSIPGWSIDSVLYTLRFEPLEAKYKVLTITGREWYTLTETFVLEIQNIARKESVIIYDAGVKQIYFY